jgi:hypothetical protein
MSGKHTRARKRRCRIEQPVVDGRTELQEQFEQRLADAVARSTMPVSRRDRIDSTELVPELLQEIAESELLVWSFETALVRAHVTDRYAAEERDEVRAMIAAAAASCRPATRKGKRH